MQSRYSKDNVQFVAISLDSTRDAGTREDAGRFLGAMKPAFPVYNFADRMQALHEIFAFEYLPTIFVIDKAGIPRKFEGAFPLSDVERAVRENLKH
jgi:hypothetical protein